MRRRRSGVMLRGPARLASAARLLAQTPLSASSSSSLSPAPPSTPATVATVFTALRPARHLSMALASLCAAVVLHGAAVAATASIKNRRANRRHTVAVATDTTEAWPEEPQAPPPKKKAAEPTAQTATQPTSTSTSTAVASSAPAGLSSSSLLPAGLSAGGFGVGAGGGGVGDGRGISPSTVPVATTRPTSTITPARARTRAPPRYPAAARKSGTTGTVTLQIHVDEHGAVTDVRVVDSTPAGLFDDAAIEAARRFTFDPAVTADGGPVASWVRQTIRFTLEAS